MNGKWKEEIVPGALVWSEHDDDKDIWKVIAIDEGSNLAWIRNTRTSNNVLRERPFMFPSK